MTGLIIAASLLAAHVTGAIELVAPTLGQIGTFVSATDHAVTDAVTLKNYVATKRAAKKKVVR